MKFHQIIRLASRTNVHKENLTLKLFCLNFMFMPFLFTKICFTIYIYAQDTDTEAVKAIYHIAAASENIFTHTLGYSTKTVTLWEGRKSPDRGAQGSCQLLVNITPLSPTKLPN